MTYVDPYCKLHSLIPKKKSTLFECQVLTADTVFYVSYWRQDGHFSWSSKPREGLPVCSAKAVPSFLSYFKTLSIGPGPGIKPATSCSAVKRSTIQANPGAVEGLSLKSA